MTRKWWHEKVAYQIYPKSFYDANQDGIGDLKGIIQKLDYLKEFGVDIVWISPIYRSPLADQGYDISDYYSIDPRFGTMEDMDTLIAEAKKRGMGILMDLVVNHCSDEHEWFKKACADPDGKYGKFFYIRDRKKGEPLPCNWRSYFGGPVWDLLPGHEDKIYLHVFHKKQPDLNWENPEMRQEIGMGNFRYGSVEEIDDVSAQSKYRVALDAGLTPEEALRTVNAFSRDNARSPFQWDSSENAGFSDAKPWLGVNPNYTDINLEEQKKRPDSLWNFYRSLISLRKSPEYKETVVYGETIPCLEEQKNLMAYFRRADRCLLVIGNYQKAEADVTLPAPAKKILANNLPSVQIRDHVLQMKGYQFVVMEL